MRLLPLVFAALCTGCASAPPRSELDRSTHVERVLQDVAAMIEGMAAAHSERRIVLREPSFRSSAPTPND